MSVFQLTQHGWPVGQWLIPVGSVIDTENGKDQWSLLVKNLGLPIPPNAMPLTQSTWQRMKAQYGSGTNQSRPPDQVMVDHTHRIITPPNIKR